MTVVLLGRVHGLAGRAAELPAVLTELRDAARASDGCEGFDIGEVPGETGEFLLVSTWRDEGAMRGHYASSAYSRYTEAVTPLLARPSDAVIHYADRTVHPVGDPSTEAGRQG
jgi:quinol monooxygenase YgiN